jgi:hypothetical protein
LEDGMRDIQMDAESEYIERLKEEIARLKVEIFDQQKLLICAAELIAELREAADLMIHRGDSVPTDQVAVQDCADRSGPYSNPID